MPRRTPLWADLRRVLGLWRRRRGALLWGLVLAALTALLGVALLALAGQAVAAGVVAAGTALGLLRVVALLRPLLRWSERMATHAATFRALADTRLWFFHRLAERLPAGPAERSSGDLLGRLVADVEVLDGLYLRAIVPFVAAGAVALATLLAVGAGPVGWALLPPLLGALFLPLWLAPAGGEAAAAVALRGGSLRAAVVDPLQGLEDVLATGGEGAARAAMAREGRALAEAQAAVGWRGARTAATVGLLLQGGVLASLAWGLASGSTAPLVLTALFLLAGAAESIGALPRAGTALAAAGAAARRLFDVADTPSPAPPPAGPAPEPRGHAIRFEAVRFAWRPERPAVLDGFDLDLPEGARVALLGVSGAGKSSVAALLLRLAMPQVGRITLGGVALSELEGAAVRARVALLAQDARIFDDTIAGNLRVAAPGAPDAALWRALERAGLGAFVRELPAQLATPCGEGGLTLSGGQGRRLALARVLLSPAPVWVLDEPTAGLDAATERAVFETLMEAAGSRTVLLLTHRLTGAERMTTVLRLVAGQTVVAAA